MTPEEQNDMSAMIQWIQQCICISDEQKESIISALRQGPPFLPEFAEALNNLFELEKAVRMEKIEALDEEIAVKEQEKNEEALKTLPELQKFWEEYVQEQDKVMKKLEDDFEAIDRQVEEDVKEIASKGEKSQIDAIRESLVQPKK